MTEDMKMTMVKAMSDEKDEVVISAFLSFAADDLCSIFVPHKGQEEKEAFLEKYGTAQVKLAAYYLNKRGWDFQISHNENGVSRVYETGDIPDSILRLITPQAEVIS